MHCIYAWACISSVHSDHEGLSVASQQMRLAQTNHTTPHHTPDTAGTPTMEGLQDFGQKVDLTARIREVLLNYPEGTSILKEVSSSAAVQVCMAKVDAHGCMRMLFCMRMRFAAAVWRNAPETPPIHLQPTTQ